MTESGEWWLQVENLAALAYWMADLDYYDAYAVAYMVEKPWKFTLDYRNMIEEQEGAKA